MMKRIAFLLLFVSGVASAQLSQPGVQYVTTAPSGACAFSPPARILKSTGVIYTCNNGTWGATGGGGGAGNPGGSTTQGQYNNGGLFAGSPSLIFRTADGSVSQMANVRYLSASSDIGAQFDAAVTSLGSAGGMIILPNSTNIPMSTTAHVPPNVSVQGYGKLASIVNCTVAGDCFSYTQNPTTNGEIGGEYFGFEVNGSGASNQVLWHNHGMSGATMHDIQFEPYAGSGNAATCLEFENAATGQFTESVVTYNVSLERQCTTGVLFSQNAGDSSNSFGYNFFEFHVVSQGANYAVTGTGTAYLYNGSLTIYGNHVGPGGGILQFLNGFGTDAALGVPNERLYIAVEENGSGAGVVVNLPSGTGTARFYGNVVNGAFNASGTSLATTYNDPTNALNLSSGVPVDKSGNYNVNTNLTVGRNGGTAGSNGLLTFAGNTNSDSVTLATTGAGAGTSYFQLSDAAAAASLYGILSPVGADAAGWRLPSNGGIGWATNTANSTAEASFLSIAGTNIYRFGSTKTAADGLLQLGGVALKNSAQTFATTLGSVATADSTFNFPATVPTTGHLLGCTTTGSTCLITDLGAPGGGLSGLTPGFGVGSDTASTIANTKWFFADLFPSSCTVNAVAYTTQADCAFYTAQFYATTNSQSPMLVFGAGTYTTAKSFVMATGLYVPKIYGTGQQSTILQYTGASHIPVISRAAGSSSFTDVHNMTIDGNYVASAEIDILNLNQSYISDLTLINNYPNTTYFMRVGSGFQVNVSRVQMFENSGSGLGNFNSPTTYGYLTCTPSAGAIANAQCTLTNAGTGYPSGAATLTLIFTGFQNGNSYKPCTTMPVGTATVSGTTVASFNITTNGAGCVGTAFAVAAAVFPVTYGFQDQVSDSTFTDITSYVGSSAGIASLSSNNTWIHAHPAFVATGIYSNAAANFIGAELDNTFRYGFDFAGPACPGSTLCGVNVTGTMGFMGAKNLQSPATFYFEAGAGNTVFNGQASLCGGQQPSGWQEFATQTGTIDSGIGTWPSHVSVVGNDQSCNETVGDYIPTLTNGTINGTTIPTTATLFTLGGTAQTVTQTPTFGNAFNFGLTNSSNAFQGGQSRSGANQGVYLFLPYNATAATSGQNYNSPAIGEQSNYWNGSASINTEVQQQVQFGAGANPTQTYQFNMFGTPSSGVKQYAFDYQVASPAWQSTDTVNNGAATFGTGSGGDSTCPAPLPGTSYLCTKSAGISASINGTPYSPLPTGGINAQTGTTYAVVASDAGKLVTLSNASAVAVSISTATTAGFTNPSVFRFKNNGVGTVTITPTTSTIDGKTAAILGPQEGITLFSDGTNYITMQRFPFASSHAPTCAAGTAAGTGATCAVDALSTNGAMQITVVMGTTTGTNAAVATITFADGGFPVKKFCSLSPANFQASGGGVNLNAGTLSATTASINAGGTAPSASQTYIWNVDCP
jgi:hypothetical protein